MLKHILDEVLSSRFLAADRDVAASRRAMLLASPIPASQQARSRGDGDHAS
jgi:hypothetical protein